MSYSTIEIFSFSIVAAALIGGIRFTRISPAYYPFLICIWAGLLNEIISYIIIHSGHSNAPNSNIYILAEALLLTWQFKRWGIFARTKILFHGLIIFFVSVWVLENFVVYKITYFSSYFRMVYSFALALMSINHINVLIHKERKQLLRNPEFLICMAFVIYYTYKVMVEAFWIYGLNNSDDFRKNVYLILAYINLFANLIYALAILWMPTKHRFSLPY
jgi:hypothetical protein